MLSHSKRIDLCNGPIFGGVIKYTIPIICTSILQLLFNAADLVVVGRFCGSNSVGAVGATSSLIHMFVNLFIGMATGVSVAVAKTIGEKDENKVSKIIHTAIPLSFFVGLFLTVFGTLLSTPILQLMKTPADTLSLSSIYIRIYFCGMIPSLVFEFAAAIYRASGDTETPFKYLSLAGVINVLLNVFFVTVIDLDVAGVALATVISQTVSCVLIVSALMRRNDYLKLKFKKMHIYLDVFKSILKIGLPAGIQASIFSMSNVIIQSSVNSFGSVAVAGNAAAANIEAFVYQAMHSFYHTSLNFTGQNIGAKKSRRVKKALLTNILCSVALGLILGNIIIFFNENLLSIYITDNLASIDYGIIRMNYICRFYFLCGIMEVLTGAIRGMGKSLVSMLISIVGVCGIRLGWVFTVFQMEKYHSLDSLYFSYIVSWIACILAQIVAFIIIYKKFKKKCITE
jgi:putative MATE family efflux protein